MKLVQVDPHDPEPRVVAGAAAVLEACGVVAIPTETFYGLAADSRSAEALVRLNAIKGKGSDSPILLLAADVGQVSRVAQVGAGDFHRLAAAFWPGPLTLVLQARPDLPSEVGAGTGTVAVRVPGLELPRRLAALLGRPVSGVSANRHGRPPCKNASEILENLVDGVEMVLDGGSSPGERPSTIVDLTGRSATVLREGAVSSIRLRACLEPTR